MGKGRLIFGVIAVCAIVGCAPEQAVRAGDTSIESGADIEPNLPEGWSIYPGATVEYATNIVDGNGGGAIVMMRIDAEADAIIEHYRQEAEATGHVVEFEQATEQSRIIGGKSPDGGQFTVGLVPNPEGGPSQVQLTVGTDPGG